MEAYHTPDAAAHELMDGLQQYVAPLLERLDERLDKRLVRSLLALLQAMLMHRHREHGLLLSELGAYITGDAHAPAGTKRLSNLLRSPKWDHTLIDEELWRQAQAYVANDAAAKRQTLVIWDDSIVEKSESIASPDLCPVRSSKAARKLRHKPGYHQPPTTRPIFVPGFEVSGLLVVNAKQAPQLAHLHFWTRRGPHAQERKEVGPALFAECVRRLGTEATHVCDRGYCSGGWVGRFLEAGVPFVLRWRTDYHLVDAKGKRASGAMMRGQRSLEFRTLRDAHGKPRRVGILYRRVTHPEHPETPLWLVVGRPPTGAAWHFLTNQPVESLEAAWAILYTYMRRWQVEMAFRYLKSELALESPRLHFWENRLKLFAIVALLYAYLLSLLAATWTPLRTYLLKQFCKRTGKWQNEVDMPLYRLRLAIMRLLLCHPVRPVWPNPG